MATPQTYRTDAWVAATWEEYIRTIEDPAFEKAKGYYYDGRMRIEMSPVGSDHAKDHGIVSYAVYQFAAIKNLDFTGLDNCSYRKAGYSEFQPDASFYIGETADAIPYGTSIVDLNIYPPPTLVIEVANTSLTDDRGEKRLMYEELGIQEYWIVDVQNIRVFAFAIENRGSRRIEQSIVLPGLAIALLEDAFRRTRQINHGKVSAWLLKQFQQH
ncbi:MAG: Uma2 family endonuclease [Microcoleus sp. SIO2G3]|nr:Uma2 family endonuclease [Microcoleus sp. SIO2G3]